MTCVIDGAALTGARGNLWGVAAGALILVLILNIVIILGLMIVASFILVFIRMLVIMVFMVIQM